MAELGFLPCPDCKKGTCMVGKNKRGFAFYYCDRCMSQLQTRSGEGSDGLLARMTPVDGSAPPSPGDDDDDADPPGDDDMSKKGENNGDKQGDRRQSNDRRSSSSTRTKAGDQDQRQKKESTFGKEIFGEDESEGGNAD